MSSGAVLLSGGAPAFFPVGVVAPFGVVDPFNPGTRCFSLEVAGADGGRPVAGDDDRASADDLLHLLSGMAAPEALARGARGSINDSASGRP